MFSEAHDIGVCFFTMGRGAGANKIGVDSGPEPES